MTVERLTLYLREGIRRVLGIPVLLSEGETPAGVGAYAVLTLSSWGDGQALNTYSAVYEVTIRVLNQQDSERALQTLLDALRKLTLAGKPEGALRDMVPYASCIGELVQITPTQLTYRYTLEVDEVQ